MKDKEHTIIRLRFKEKPDFIEQAGNPEYFFGSLAAIYDVFTAQQIGCAVTRLWQSKITPEKPFINKKCTISKVVVRHKTPQNRKS